MGDYGTLQTRLAAAEAAMRNEEEQLLGLGVGVRDTKNIAGLIQDEVNAQNDLLDDIESGMNRTQQNMDSTVMRTEQLERDPYSWRNFVGLLGPLVLLLVIALFWIRHLIVG